MKTSFTTRKDFVERRRPPGAALRKEFATAAKQIGPIADRTLEFLITTDSVDRQGDRVAATGWKTGQYLANPVVLFNHRYDSLPIGKTIKLTPFIHGLRAEVKFAPANIHQFAEQVFQMCLGGFLNAASVGFIPLEYEEADRDGYHPMDIKKQELIEWSIVSVPANGEALIGKAAALAEIKSIRQRLSASLAPLRKALARQGHTAGSRDDITKEDITRICDAAADRAGLPRNVPDLTAEQLEIVVDAMFDAYLLNEGSLREQWPYHFDRFYKGKTVRRT